jgi:hypothetical protein
MSSIYKSIPVPLPLKWYVEVGGNHKPSSQSCIRTSCLKGLYRLLLFLSGRPCVWQNSATSKHDFARIHWFHSLQFYCRTANIRTLYKLWNDKDISAVLRQPPHAKTISRPERTDKNTSDLKWNKETESLCLRPILLKAEDEGGMFSHNNGTHLQVHSVTTRKTTIQMFTAVRTTNFTSNSFIFSSRYTAHYEPGSSASTVSDYGPDDRSSIPDRDRGLSSTLFVQTGSGAIHPPIQ